MTVNQLRTEINIIKNEWQRNKNTGIRVGEALNNIVDFFVATITGGVQLQLIFTDVEVLTTDFVADTTYETEGYVYKAEITCEDVTADMFCRVVFSPAQSTTGNYATICDSGAEKVIIYAKEVPSSTFTIPTIKAELI